MWEYLKSRLIELAVNPVDLVYILGTGSHWNDNEIRYSLRSVKKHFTGYRNIYIIGSCPAWLTPDFRGNHVPAGLAELWTTGGKLIHIEMKDPFPGRSEFKERNIMLKTLAACNLPSISERFLFLNDDYFFLQKISAPTFPNYHIGELLHAVAARSRNDGYKTSQSNTWQALTEAGHTTLKFDIHYPIIYNKQSYIKVMQQYDWSKPWGYVIKSLYANTMGLTGVYMPDCKMYSRQKIEGLRKEIAGKKMFSIGNWSDIAGLQQLLDELYPTPSPYEKNHDRTQTTRSVSM